MLSGGRIEPGSNGIIKPRFDFVCIVVFMCVLFGWFFGLFTHQWWVYHVAGYSYMPDANHAKPMPLTYLKGKVPFRIRVTRDRVYLGSERLEENELSTLHKLIPGVVKDRGCRLEGLKVFLLANELVRWGVIVKVLKEIEKANIHSVIFVTKAKAYYHDYGKYELRDFYDDLRLYVEKYYLPD